MTSSGGSNDNGNNPWGWLGLLKWSLAHCDGTAPSPESKMSEEDKKFLEQVMKDGIIDENERMKEILKQVATTLDSWKEKNNAPPADDEIDQVEELLQELRDIVEQIDYARAFCAMKGLPFLLGCVSEKSEANAAVLPRSIRLICLGILSTLCQNNPPVQSQLLELGAMKLLSDVFFQEINNNAALLFDGTLCARIMQAIGSIVRSHEQNEQVFYQLEQSKQLLEYGLGMNNNSSASSPLVLTKRTLFFLSALITSDLCTTQDKITFFDTHVAFILDNHVLLPSDNNNDSSSADQQEICEMSVALLSRLLEQHKCDNLIQPRKDQIMNQANHRIQAIYNLQGDDREFATIELEYWQSIIQHLESPNPGGNNNQTPMLLLGNSSQAQHDVLPQ